MKVYLSIKGGSPCLLFVCDYCETMINHAKHGNLCWNAAYHDGHVFAVHKRCTDALESESGICTGWMSHELSYLPIMAECGLEVGREEIAEHTEHWSQETEESNSWNEQRFVARVPGAVGLE